MKIGGLRLLERAILTLHKAGVEHFRIVVGAYREETVPSMKALKRLQHLDIEYVVCEDYEKGNGVSFGAGASGFDEPFLLAMSDHIFSPDTIENFIQKTAQNPDLPALACDPLLDEIFDMNDATKVKSKGGFIHNIGKKIPDYDLVDTGLFYFPQNYGKKIAALAANGAHSVSHIIQAFINERGVRAVALEKPVWQDVDTPDMKKEAERRLARQVAPASGSPFAQWQRTLTGRLSFGLANLRIPPVVVTTFVLILTLISAFIASSGTYSCIALGSLLFLLATLFDGVSGQLARLTLRTSKRERWYQQFTKNARPFIFFAALGIGAWHTSGSQVYLLAVALLVVTAVYMLVKVGTHADLLRTGRLPDNIVPDPAPPRYDASLLGSSFNFWRELVRQDMLAFVTFIFCIFFLSKAMFWLALLGITATAIIVSQSVASSAIREEEVSTALFNRVNPFYFYLIGFGILIALVFSLDLRVVTRSLTTMGNGVFLIFSVALLWIIANTLCLRTLVRGEVPFADLMFNQLAGEAYNSIIPMAGLGGEPYKIKHLTQWLDWHTASRAVVTDRFIHSSSGLTFSAVCLGLTLYLFDLQPTYFIVLAVMASVFMVTSLALTWVALTPVPSRLAGFILKKLKIVESYREEPVPLKVFAQAYFFKFLGRSFNLIEIYLIFVALGLAPGFFDLTAVAGFISTSAALFFVIPQGLGVNELGISTALNIIGYTAALGITFGLVRRARMIFWALFGVALHLAVSVAKKFSWSRI